MQKGKLYRKLKMFIPNEHFKYQDPQSPPINRKIMSFVLYYFWRNVFWGTTKCPCPLEGKKQEMEFV